MESSSSFVLVLVVEKALIEDENEKEDEDEKEDDFSAQCSFDGMTFSLLQVRRGASFQPIFPVVAFLKASASFSSRPGSRVGGRRHEQMMRKAMI